MNPANERYMIQNECHVKAQWAHGWRYPLGGAAAASATGIHAAITMTEAAQPGIVADITQPDFPRVLTVTGGHADCAGKVTIHGTDIDDNVISDEITQNGVATVAGVKAFKSVTSLDIPARSSANTPTVTIGTAAVFGLPLVLPSVDCVETCAVDGVAEAVTSVVINTDIAKNVAASTTAPNGTRVIVFRGYIYTA